MSVQPRKPAKQHRSKATIDALLEATARIVADVGLEPATTNRIAEVAGVSIGSLYQYFPGKASLLAALIEREAEADLAALSLTIEESRALPLPDALALCVSELVRRHARHPGLYRWMLRYVPELGQHQKVRAIAGRGRALLRDLLGERRAELRQGLEPALGALVLGAALEAAVHAALFDRPESLSDGSLSRELEHLCVSYLR